MNENQWNDSELEIEEWKVLRLKSIDERYNTLALGNRAGKQIDDAAIRDRLASIPGIKGIKSLIIQPSSMLKNLSILEAVPALEKLKLYGLRLRVLDGLQWFRHGWFIKIDTDKNRDRKIDKIAETKITKFVLHFGNPEDLDAIGRNSTIRELILGRSPNLLLDRWRGLPIESMTLSGGVLDKLADTTHIHSLRKLILTDCRKLERFEGNNGNVTWMVIQTCNRLDFRTISTFSGVQSLGVVNIKNEVLLSAFAGLSQLRTLDLLKCKVRVDVMDIKSSAPALREIRITGLKKDQAIALSKANSGVVATNGVWSYENGILVPTRDISEP